MCSRVLVLCLEQVSEGRGRSNGAQRWYCKDCNRYFSGRRQLTADKVSGLYSKGNMRVSDIAERFGISERTVYRRLGAAPESQMPCPQAREVVVLMDVTYWGWHFGVIIMKDALQGRVLWHKFLNKKETIADYREGILWLEQRVYQIRGIVSYGLKGLREAFPQYKFQLCQFHQVKLIKNKLTSHPKLPASQELLRLPNTNNALESLNSDLKGKLCLHRGVSIERKKALDSGYYISHNPHG